MIKETVVSLLDRSALSFWATVHTGRRLRVDMSNTVGRSIYLRKTYEPAIEKVVNDMLKAGDVFVDVGANVGYFSLMAADIVGSTGQVISIEPNIALCQLVRASARRNRFGHWNVVPAGVGDSTGLAKLQIQQSSGVSFIGDTSGKRDRVVDVQMTPILTLDDIIAELSPDTPPKLVKVDVEGLELRVLEGARACLQGRKTHFVVEHSARNQARFGISATEVAEFMAQFGYQPTPITTDDVDYKRSDILWCPSTKLRVA